MVATHRPAVTVFGASGPRPGEETYETARSVGAALAGLGYNVANGGYGGVMEASARGAVEGGGQAIGVTCSIWPGQANEYAGRVVQTDTHEQRLAELIELGEAGYVVLPGATGTLVELSTVWELMCKRLLPRRPLVCVGTWWQPVIDLMIRARPRSGEYVAMVATTDEFGRHFPGRNG